MQNGTRRFNEIEKYICSLPEPDQDFAVAYYHSILNRQRLNSESSEQFTLEIADKINEIMYKI